MGKHSGERPSWGPTEPGWISPSTREVKRASRTLILQPQIPATCCRSETLSRVLPRSWATTLGAKETSYFKPGLWWWFFNSFFLLRRDKKAFLSDQCKEIEENNRMGKTRDLFKKIRDTKGIFHAKMGSVKDRNGMDLTEAEDIKKR